MMGAQSQNTNDQTIMVNQSVSRLQGEIDEESILKEVLTNKNSFIHTIDHSNKKTFVK